MLGVKGLDSGHIKILQETVSTKRPLRSINSIGYMPQETALSEIMTIEETLIFFGNISQMNMKLFDNQYKIIAGTLEMPKGNVLIGNLSGGEKRRISLAVALIHDPELLILDEPMVGLDVVICTKIWDFLRQSTSSEKRLSVLISTHYPHDAEKSHICGFIRNGTLLCEDSPKNITKHLNVQTLDEAALELCYRKYNDELLPADLENSKSHEDLIDDVKGRKLRRIFELQTLLGLLVKKYQWFKRTKKYEFLHIKLKINLGVVRKLRHAKNGFLKPLSPWDRFLGLP